MSKRKYKPGVLIESIEEFEICLNFGATLFYTTHWGKTVHCSILINQQYRVLKDWIKSGLIYTALMTEIK